MCYNISMVCLYCNAPLSPPRSKYCSRSCNVTYLVDKRRKDLKSKAIDYKGGSCLDCGYKRCKAALVFHHRDPSEKSFPPANMYRYKWEVIIQELDKCDLLCQNCHAERHCSIDNGFTHGELTEWLM